MKPEGLLQLAEGIVADEFPLSLDAFRLQAPDVIEATEDEEAENRYLAELAKPGPQAEFGMVQELSDAAVIISTTATVMQLSLMLVQMRREARSVSKGHKTIDSASRDLAGSLRQVFGSDKAERIATQFEQRAGRYLDA